MCSAGRPKKLRTGPRAARRSPPTHEESPRRGVRKSEASHSLQVAFLFDKECERLIVERCNAHACTCFERCNLGSNEAGDECEERGQVRVPVERLDDEL